MSAISPLVLYAEDEFSNQKLFEFALELIPHSFEVVYVNNGEEVLNYLNQSIKIADVPHFKRPSAILLDMNMPRINGLEALEVIKAEPYFSDIPVIMFSSLPEEKVKSKTLALGAIAFLEKPVGVEKYDEVIRLLESVCGEKGE